MIQKKKIREKEGARRKRRGGEGGVKRRKGAESAQAHGVSF